MVNLGSFAGGQGQEAIQAAMQARAEGGQMPPQLQQTMGNQSVPAPVGAQPPGGMPGMSDPGVQGAQPPKTEQELIIKALSQRLGSISKVEEAQSAPPAPTPTQSPGFAPEGSSMSMGSEPMQDPMAGMPMGGGGYRRY